MAEAFEPFMTQKNPQHFYYTIMGEQQFQDCKIDVTYQRRKIVGTVAVCKSHTLDKGAWMKRLYVEKNYRRKGIASFVIKTAVEFATAQGYSSISSVTSEHQDGGRELCIKRGFELKQMYHKPLLGSIATVLMYEMINQIKPDNDSYASNLRSGR